MLRTALCEIKYRSGQIDPVSPEEIEEFWEYVLENGETLAEDFYRVREEIRAEEAEWDANTDS